MCIRMDPKRTALEMVYQRSTGIFLPFPFFGGGCHCLIFIFAKRKNEGEKKKKERNALWMILYLCHKYTGENLNDFPVHGRKKIFNTPVYFDELC